MSQRKMQRGTIHEKADALGNLTGNQVEFMQRVKEGGADAISELQSMLVKKPTRLSILVDDEGNNVFHLSGNAKITNYLWQYILHVEFPPNKLREGRAELRCMLMKENARGRTPLIEMIKKGALDCIQELHSIGANFNEMTKDGETPLGIAIRTGNPALVETLIMCGANTRQRSCDELPETIARSLPEGKGRIKILKALSKFDDESCRDDEFFNPPNVAVMMAQEARIKIQKLDESSEEETKVLSSPGFTPYMTLMTVNDGDLFQRILFEDSDTLGMGTDELACEIVKNAADTRRSFMALDHLRMKHNFSDEDIMGFKDRNGRNIMLSSSTPEMTNKLCEITYSVRDKQTAILREKLIDDVRSEECEQITVLWANGADVNIEANDGKTLLHIAIEKGNIDLIRTLLVCGANVNMKSQGKSPIEIAEASPNSNREAIRELLQDFVNPRGDIPVEAKPKQKAVLCLDGGGIKGLVLVTVLKYIQYRCNKPITELFDFVGGTSTGGIVALVLGMKENNLENLKKMTGANDRLDILQRLYFKMVKQVFNGGFADRSIAMETLLKDACKDVLMKHVGKTEADNEIMRVMVTTLDVSVFPPIPTLIKSYDSVEEELKVWEAARCTPAAPTYFLNCNYRLDGGLFANNPTLDVLSEISRLDSMTKDKKKCVVSVGCGKEVQKDFDYEDITAGASDLEGAWWNLFSWFKKGSVLWSNYSALGKAAKVLMHQTTISSGSPVDRSGAWCKSVGWPFYRFEPEFDEVIDLDEQDTRKLHILVWETRKYMNANQEMLDSLVKDLIGK